MNKWELYEQACRACQLRQDTWTYYRGYPSARMFAENAYREAIRGVPYDIETVANKNWFRSQQASS